MREGSDSPARTFDVIVGSRGRVTLPPEVREHFGLQNGGQILFILSGDDRAEIAPARVRTKELGRADDEVASGDGDASLNFVLNVRNKNG